MLEILCRLSVILAAFEMHSQLRGDFPDVVSVKILFTRPDPPMHLNAARQRYPFIQHVLIQGVPEAVPRHRGSFRNSNDISFMNELMLTSEFVTAGFYRRHIFIQCGGHGVYRELGSCDACGFESALLLGIEVIDVFLDHVLDTVGHAERHVFYICN